jgi:phage shock protein A
VQVKELKQQVATLQAATDRLHKELECERSEVSKLQSAAMEASARLTTSLAEACAAVARAEAAEAATSAVEGEKEAAEEEIAALGDRAEDLSAECSELNLQCKVCIALHCMHSLSIALT